MAVRLVGLDCSPRDGSNSGLLLTRSFERLAATYPGEVEHDVVVLRDLAIEGCHSCDICGKTKDGRFVPCICAKKDDVQGVLDAMVAADGIVIATPVYFGLPSDLFAKFVMRTRVLRHQDFRLANRPVGVMAIAGRRSGGAETTILADLAALHPQRLPGGRQRRRHLAVRRLRLGRSPRRHPHRRVGHGAGLPGRRARLHRGQGRAGRHRRPRLHEPHDVLVLVGHAAAARPTRHRHATTRQVDGP